MVHKISTAEGLLIIDDCIVPKKQTKPNALINWHYNHCSRKSVKRLNKKRIRSGKPIKFRIPQRNKLNIETKATISGAYFPQTNNAIIMSIRYIIILLFRKTLLFYSVNL
jgi:hypothetical protein